MEHIRAYIAALIVVANMTPAQVQAQVTAANMRDYNVGATFTRNIGDPVGLPLVVMRQPATVKTLTIIVGFAPSCVAPTLPGGRITLANGTIDAALTGTAGEVSITYAGAMPAAGASIYSVPFKCTAAGKCQFSIKSITAKDGAGASVTVTGASLDTLVIQDSGAIIAAIE